MTPAALIRGFEQMGVKLAARGDTLHVTAAAGTLSPERRAMLVQHKAALLAELRSEAAAFRTRWRDAAMGASARMLPNEPAAAPAARALTPAERAAMEAAYAELARTLVEHPETRRAIGTLAPPEDVAYVLLAVAVRGAGYCTLRIPRKRYDGFKVIELLDRASGRGREPRTAVHC